MVKYRQKVKGGDAMEIEKSDLEWLVMLIVVNNYPTKVGSLKKALID